MSFGPPLIIKHDDPPKPWTRRDSWALAAYVLCSAANISAALYAAQHAQPQPPATATQPAVTQQVSHPR